jgi:hypothetical protein
MRQRLADAVDLIVGLTLRERQQFGLKLRQERRPLGKKHKTRLELRLVDVHPSDFVPLDRNEPYRSAKMSVLESCPSVVPVEASSIST